MTLKNYFTLITISIFQDTKKKYNETYFSCPVIICKDGFNVSLQINHANYCTSENGYRELGVDWQEVEFGFPSENDKDMFKFSESYGYGGYDDEGNEIPFNEEDFDVTDTVGRIPVEDMQKILDNHGGIDWDATLSFDVAKNILNKK